MSSCSSSRGPSSQPAGEQKQHFSVFLDNWFPFKTEGCAWSLLCVGQLYRHRADHRQQAQGGRVECWRITCLKQFTWESCKMLSNPKIRTFYRRLYGVITPQRRFSATVVMTWLGRTSESSRPRVAETTSHLRLVSTLEASQIALIAVSCKHLQPFSKFT